VELPRLQALWEKYRAAGLSVIALDASADREGALKFIEENSLTYHFLENNEEDVVGRSLMIQSFPTTLLLDEDGRILFYHSGFEEGDEAKLEEHILQILDLSANPKRETNAGVSL
jgi:peroxiredoxin